MATTAATSCFNADGRAVTNVAFVYGDECLQVADDFRVAEVSFVEVDLDVEPVGAE